jgi:heterodisulfide reductase subunit B
MVLAARNLAIAEAMNPSADIVVPCSACYLNLRRVEDHVQRDGTLMERINEALREEGVVYRGGVKVRHLLDVMVRDFDPEAVRSKVQRNLGGLKVAPYYGCQALRPYPDFDDPEEPRSMEPLLKALGAEIHPWAVGGRCCGAALMSTKKEVALQLTGNILKSAKGADCIVTVCPMCEMNLEAYQGPAGKALGADLGIPILYLPQIVGIALGLSGKALRMDLNLALTSEFRRKMAL